MPWPTPQDYNESIQNPLYCFQDPELKASRPELTRIGLPKATSGRFASVYRMECGAVQWAVRCFSHPLKDHAER